MVCLKTLFTCTSSRCTGLCRANLSKSCTISFVRWVSRRMICKSSRADPGTSGFSSSRSVNPKIAASGLLTSCATPETSRPIVAIFSLWASFACSNAASVMSVITTTTLFTAFCSSLIGLRLIEKCPIDPSLRRTRSDGSMGHFSISLSPMRDEQNAVNSVVVVMTDITDAALLQAKLAHSEKMATIGRLVSGVAHEVNNPLAAILGFTDLLLENPEVPVSAREDLQIILQETQRTKDIVQDLLSFARQRPVQREPVQLNGVLRQTIKLRSYDFASHGVEGVEDFEETLTAALGDSQQLQQVFLNILNNAYDAVQVAGQRGLIRIHTRRQAEMIEVAISDNGTGIIDPQRSFDPFYTTKQVGKGTGLGLSICYGIVRAHGGGIQCWNNEAGAGSTFVVRVSVGTGAALAAATTKEARP